MKRSVNHEGHEAREGFAVGSGFQTRPPTIKNTFVLFNFAVFVIFVMRSNASMKLIAVQSQE